MACAADILSIKIHSGSSASVEDVLVGIGVIIHRRSKRIEAPVRRGLRAPVGTFNIVECARGFSSGRLRSTPGRILDVILLFDLAGVLLEFRGIESSWEISRGTVDENRFARFWSESPVADRLYRGLCTPMEFAAGTVAEWQLPVAAADFLAEFRRWLVGPYPGAFELLARLQGHHHLACLSNTNELDCRRFREELRLHERFERCFFSNEIGLRKPEVECYRFVLKALNAQGSDVIFFDDSHECVEGARAAGLQAYRCVGVDSLVEQLRALNL
jgi:HAD superfamily hydrolase (TIGR01509 family)